MSDAPYRRKLAATREADSAHEAMMQGAAAKAHVNLAHIRKMGMEDKDAALVKMFRAAAGDAP